MKRVITRLACLLLLGLTLPVAAALPAVSGQEGKVAAETLAPPQKDEAAIRQAIANWDAGWRNFDDEIISRDYADDADWTNAFGVPRQGRAAIRAYLAKGLASPEWRSRRSTPSTVDIRFLKPDIAVVRSSRQTTGQKTASGQEYPVRKTHDLRVFVLKDGRWLIASHLIMDEKEVRP